METLLLRAMFLVAVVNCQEDPGDWPGSYNVGPYIHIYPPINISASLSSSCSPQEPESNETCPLFIQLLMSFGGDFTSSGLVPGFQIALDQINSRKDLLPGYSLHYTLQDSQCDRTVSLDSLYAGLFHPPTKIAVMGGGCSTATEATAEVSHYYNLIQLSCSSSSTELMNRHRFRNHFQVFPASITQGYGYFGIIQDSRWQRVAIIFEDEFLFTSPMNELKRLLMEFNVNYTEVKYEPGVDPFQKDDQSRIYVLSMYSPHAREVLCKAYQYRSDFKYPRNLFLINGNYHNKWWEGDAEEQARLMRDFNCDVQERESLVPFTLGVIVSGLEIQNYSTVAENGYTGKEIEELYDSYLSASRLNVTEDFVYQLCYDSVWVLALALNKTISDLNSDESLMRKLYPFLGENGTVGLQQFSYDNPVFTENIFHHLSHTNYKGIVGNISFNENGSRTVNLIDINQYRYQENGEIVPSVVAKVHWRNTSYFNFTYLESDDAIWPQGIPYDGTITDQIVSVHLALTVIFGFFGLCGIVLAIGCIICNIYFRNERIIRLTSPYLNILIGTGAILLYLNMMVHIIPSKNSIMEKWLCNLDSWLISIGYSLCFGTIVAKMCRIYYIFTNPISKKWPLKDWKLAIFVLLLVVVDVVILTFYLVVEGFTGTLEPSRVPSPENFEEIIGVYQKTFHNYIYLCNSRNRHIMLGVLYGYKAILQIISLILAISTRKVPIKGLNDVQYIIPAIYITSIVTTVIIVSTYTMAELVNAYAVILCLCLFIGTTVVLMLVYLPPLFSLSHNSESHTVLGWFPEKLRLKSNVMATDKNHTPVHIPHNGIRTN